MNGDEHGPWEDFAPAQTKDEQKGPWEDFKPEAQDQRPPWYQRSLLGESGWEVPSGAGTTMPGVTIPLSIAGKTVGGVAHHFTTPEGVAELGALATPAAPLVPVKWAYDMIKGGVKSAEAAAENVAGMVGRAINNKIISANQLGVPEKLTPAEKQEEIQALAENSVNTVLGLAGGLGIVGGKAMGGVKPKPIEKGIPDAQTIRRDQEVLPQAREIPEGGQADRGGNVQQKPSGPPDVPARPSTPPDTGVNAVVPVPNLPIAPLAKTTVETMSPEETQALAPPGFLPPQKPVPKLLEAQRARLMKRVEQAKMEGVLREPEKPPEGAFFQGVRGGNLGSEQGKSGWLTDSLDLAKSYAHRPGEPVPGRIDVYDPKDLPPREQIREGQEGKTNIYSYTALEGISPVGQMVQEGGKWVYKPNEPPMVGMGGAVPDEFQTAGTGQDIYGIAHRVRQQRAAAGQVAAVPRGEGITTPDSIETGRTILSKNPKAADDALDLFEMTKNINADAMATVRAKGEELAQVARNVEEQFGTDSPEYRTAYETLSKWDERTKPMQTEWHRAGMAQQGETDIDTGTFTGLQQAYQSDTGKVFTPKQAVTAKEFVGRVKVATAGAVEARDKLYNQLELELGKVDVPAPKNLDEARMLFAKYKSGKGFTPQQVKTLWNAAKTLYIDKGETNFDDIRHGLAKDFGLSVDDVTKALAQPKNIKRLTDEAWKKQTDARNVQESAKRWLKDAAMPGWERALAKIPRGTFAAKVFGHGTVALGTHAPMLAFHPPTWKIYGRNFGRMYKMVGSPAFYEKQVQDLIRNKNFLIAKRAGLQNDPFQYEDYTDPKIAQYFGRISGMGNRGYAVLKMLRQDIFDKQWNSLNANSRTPEVAKALSDSINHVTGVVKSSPPRGSHIVLFAPRLGMSRAAWLTVDPIRAIRAAGNWKNASEAEKMFAINQIKEKATMAATGVSLLALNQALLELTGSKQNVNMTDPMRGDYMKFKGFDLQVSYGNPMLNLARLPARAWMSAHQKGKLSKLVYPDENTAATIFRFFRTQLSPIAGLSADLFLGSDYQNRPLPFSDQPAPKRLRAEGIDQYTWPEYVSEVALPIPFAEAAREVWHDMNASEADISTLWKALATTAFMGGTGGRVQEDLNPFQQ